jgi:hypothetical protein
MTPEQALFRCVRPGRCVRLGLLRRACELDCRSRFSAALGLAAALGFSLRVGVLCCTVVERSPNPPFPALGLAAALGLALFGVRAS